MEVFYLYKSDWKAKAPRTNYITLFQFSKRKQGFHFQYFSVSSSKKCTTITTKELDDFTENGTMSP